MLPPSLRGLHDRTPNQTPHNPTTPATVSAMAISGNIFDQVQQLLGSVSASEAEARIAQLAVEIQDKQAEQQKWYSLLALKQQLGVANTAASGSQDNKPTLRQAITISLEARAFGDVVALAALRDDLVRRGWLTSSESDYHRLQMMASAMARKGQLERPTKGRYRLASSNGSAGESLSEAPSSASGEYERHSSRIGNPDVGAPSQGSEAQARIA
jgi:hypothetical protein